MKAETGVKLGVIVACAVGLFVLGRKLVEAIPSASDVAGWAADLASQAVDTAGQATAAVLNSNPITTSELIATPDHSSQADVRRIDNYIAQYGTPYHNIPYGQTAIVEQMINDGSPLP